VQSIIEMTPAAEATIKAAAFENGRVAGRMYGRQSWERWFNNGGRDLCDALFGEDVVHKLWQQNWEAGRRKGLRDGQRERARERWAERKRTVDDLTGGAR
jgi:hypothetical protein